MHALDVPCCVVQHMHLMCSSPSLLQVSDCHGVFTLGNREQACIEYIRRAVGEAKVLVN